MAVRRAPATCVAPFHLRFHPLLRRSFWILFLFPFLFLPLLRHTYVTLTLSTASPLVSPISFRFFSLLRAPFRLAPADISISTFVALANFHVTTLSRNYVPRRCLSHTFPSDSFVANDFLEFLRNQSVY